MPIQGKRTAKMLNYSGLFCFDEYYTCITALQ